MTSEPTFDVTALLLRGWARLLVGVLLGLAAGVVYGFVAPEWYSATLTVVPSQRSQDSAAMALAAKLPAGLDTFSTDVQRIQAVLASTSVGDEVIAKFKLQDRYGADHIEQARAALWKHCASSVDRRSGLVSLTCEDKDPKMAMDMAAYFGEVGNKVFGRVSVSSAREERKFLEDQVLKARRDVDEASRKLREFQEQHKVVDLPEQSKAVISAMASIKGEMISKQLELSYLTSFSARTEASVVQLQQQIAIMESKLKQLEDAQHVADPAKAGSGAGSGSASFFPDAMTVPELRFQLEQLMREQKIQETVFSLMTQRYEMAKVDEARDTSTFQILDQPTLPTYRSRPDRKRAVLLGAFAGLAAAAALLVLPVWWRRRLATKP
jgi:capsule polysaccharide export protein KpsE/RkpR